MDFASTSLTGLPGTCSQPPGLNCTNSSWVLKPNSDISGKGILTGFSVTAISTLLLCVAYYLVDHERASNPVDRYCIGGFYRLFRKSGQSKKWTEALEAAVLSFSDQQIVTGIAILTSGYSQLRGGLAVYYWQLTVDLAWFSSVTHLTTLTCLRYYFHERRGVKFVRLIFMAVMAGMLSCAVASTGYLGDENFSYDYPAWCLFHRTLMKTAKGGYDDDGWNDRYYNIDYVVLVLMFLFVSYCARIVQLFPTRLDELRKIGYDSPNDLVQGWLLKHKINASGDSYRNYWALVYTLTMAIYSIIKAAADLYSSMLWEITWLATALAWGSIRIIMDRNVNFDLQYYDPGPLSDHAKNSSYSKSQDVTCAVLDDDVWGYGQVVTVALLLAPLVSFFESIYEIVIMDRKKSGPLPTSASTLPPTESVTLDREKSGRLPTSAPTPPIPQHPGSNHESSTAEPYTSLYDYAWFRSLVWLIYLQSLATAANFLLLFPLGDGSVDLKDNIRLFIEFYSTWFGLDLAMLFFFTVTSLSLCHAQDSSDFRWTWRAEKDPNWAPSKRAKLIQRILLIVSVSILAGSSATFGTLRLFTKLFEW